MAAPEDNHDFVDADAQTMEFTPETGDGDGDGDVLEALPGLARIATSAAWRTTGWVVGNSLKASRRVLTAASSPGEALRLARDVQRETTSLINGLLDATDVGQHVSHIPEPAPPAPPSGNGHMPGLTLREEGEQLMRRSRDVRFEVDAHPAYERILSELAPDEARVLRLLLLEGPQPSVDVRTGGPLGLFSSRLIAPGISMIGARAGCRYVERVPSYLNNLFRLGLIWFSRETIRDHLKYQVLEAQPEVLDAVHSVHQAKIVRRSIHLTPFGEDFCRMALVPDSNSLAGLPEHSAPGEGKAPAQPPAEPA
jgi:hypothetical protein